MDLGFMAICGHVGALFENSCLYDATPLWVRLVTIGLGVVFLILGFFYFRGRSWPRVPLRVFSALATISIVAVAVLAGINHIQRPDPCDFPLSVVMLGSLTMFGFFLGGAVPFSWFVVALRRAKEPLVRPEADQV
jgi:hypothetical protein